MKKTRQNKEIEPPFRFNRNGKGSSADTERLSNLEDTVTFRSQFSYRHLHRRLDPSSAELRAFLTCPGEPSIDALPNYAALKLRKYPEHLEYSLTRDGRCIEPLLMQEKINSFVLQTLQNTQ